MVDSTKDTHNKTDNEKHAAAAAMLAFKLKQEEKLKSKLGSHFKQIGNYVKKKYSNNGKLPSFDKHKKIIKKIIGEHYVDTASKTSTTLRDNFKPVTVNNHKLQTLIDAHIEIDADSRSDFAADSISETTKNNFHNYIKDAIATAAIADIVLSKEDIAESLSEKFGDTTDSRIDLISQLETGIAADDGRMDEVDALEDSEVEFEDDTTIEDYKIKKTWLTLYGTGDLDDHVREAHVEANYQEVDADQPFEVGDEEMMYPRDDSLGASASNIINCRCEMVLSLE